MSAIYCPACDCHHPPREHHAPARTSLTPSDRLVPSLATSLARAVSYSADALAEARATLAEALDVLLSNNSHRAEDCHTERYAADCGECRMAERVRRLLGAPLPKWWDTYHDEGDENPCPCGLASDPRLAPAGPSVWEGTR